MCKFGQSIIYKFICFFVTFSVKLKNIENGLVPILLMSPESLFSGKWRNLLTNKVYQCHLSAIVIDEAHCVEEWCVIRLVQ